MTTQHSNLDTTMMARVKHREDLWDRLMVGLFVIFLIGTFFAIYIWQPHADSAAINIVAALIPTVLGGYPVIQLLSVLDRYVRRRGVTSYYIEEGQEVIKVFGSIRLDDWTFVKARLLRLQPGYRIVDDAYDQFGCTMAAVTASPAYLEARTALATRGITI